MAGEPDQYGGQVVDPLFGPGEPPPPGGPDGPPPGVDMDGDMPPPPPGDMGGDGPGGNPPDDMGQMHSHMDDAGTSSTSIRGPEGPPPEQIWMATEWLRLHHLTIQTMM